MLQKSSTSSEVEMLRPKRVKKVPKRLSSPICEIVGEEPPDAPEEVVVKKEPVDVTDVVVKKEPVDKKSLVANRQICCV